MKFVNFFRLQLFITLLAGVTLVSCDKDEEIENLVETPVDGVSPYEGGVFIACSGGFDKNEGAVAFLGETLNADVYASVNGSGLGDVVQDFRVIGDYGYVVVNNSAFVIVVDMMTFQRVDLIDASYPRYTQDAGNGLVYISNGKEEGVVKVYNPATKEEVKEIKVGKGPEMMAKVGNYVYVANSGGWDKDNTVSVIDTKSHTVVETIETGYAGSALKLDSNDDVWVFCGGLTEYGPGPDYLPEVKSLPSLVKIATATNEVVLNVEIEVPITTYGYNLLATSSDGKVYFVADGVYKMEIEDTTLPSEKWYDSAFYGIDVDPVSGEVYGLDGSNNKAVVINPTDASVVKEYTGLAAYPNIVYFNY